MRLTFVYHTLQCSSEGSNTDLSRIMLSGELIPTGRATADVLSVQKLAQKFVDSYTALQTKICALNAVTSEQLQETTRLKQELSLVCTGQSRYPQNNSFQVSCFMSYSCSKTEGL